MNTLLGNVSEVNLEALQKDFGPVLCDGEQIERAYKLMRDKWVFTNKRLIIQDVQGLTGKKKRLHVDSVSFRRTVFCGNGRNIRYGCGDENLDQGKSRAIGAKIRDGFQRRRNTKNAGTVYIVDKEKVPMTMRRVERRSLIDAFVGWKPCFANRGGQGGCRLCGCRNNGIMQKSRRQNKLWRKKIFQNFAKSRNPRNFARANREISCGTGEVGEWLKPTVC